MSTRRARVLIVEDEAIVAVDIAAMLVVWRACDLVFASSYAQGLARLEDGDFDLVIADVKLGRGGDGLDLLELSKAPMRVATSGYADTAMRARARDLDVLLVEKPYFGHELRALLDRAALSAGLELAPPNVDDQREVLIATEVVNAYEKTHSIHGVARVLHWYKSRVQYWIKKLDLPVGPKR